MRNILMAMMITFATEAATEEQCDVLGSLQADSMAVADPIDFANIEPLALIDACDRALTRDGENKARYILHRARGYLRLGESSKAIADIKRSHEMGYPAATFALATAYFLGDDTAQNFVKAEELFLQAYDKGVFWAARGLSSIYSDEFSDFFNEQKSVEWSTKFDSAVRKIENQ